MIKHTLLLAALFLTLTLSTAAADLPDGVTIGDKAPNFLLTNVDGRRVALETFRSTKGLLVIFTCNNCPYSIKYEDRIIALHEKYAPLGVPVLAINPNDPKVVPEDSFEKMKERAEEKGFTFPYVFDSTQETARAYGARRTPHVFLLNNSKTGFTVSYIGAIDDNPNNASEVSSKFVEDAIDAMLEGKNIATNNTKAIGCSIKWKKD
jgi:peroxiredoxin